MRLVYQIPLLLCSVLFTQISIAQTSFMLKGDSLIVSDIPLDEVTELNLNNLGLEQLPINISTYTQLRSLSLQNNQLKSLNGLGLLLYLEELDISKNPTLLGRIAAQEIGKLQSLKYLDVSHCNWGYIPSDLFQLVELKHLDVSDNKVFVLPVEIKKLSNLTWLDVHGNGIQFVKPGLKNLSNLSYLNLEGNAISNSQLTLQQLSVIKALDHLKIDGMAFEAVPELSMAHVKKLCVSNLTYDNANWMIQVFSGVESLQLEASEKGDRSAFYTELAQLESLKSLQIEDDEMVVIPLSLGRITTLQSLSVSGFQITSFEEGSFRFDHLSYFGLSNSFAINQKALYASLKHFEKLESVMFKSCGILEIDEDVTLLQQLKELDFSQNELTRLPNYLDELKTLNKISVSGNEVVLEDVNALQKAKPNLNIAYDKTINKIDLVVQPPLEDFDVPFEIFNVYAQTGQTFFANTGSRVRIPANAFLYADGSVVTGRIDVNYREFNDPLDMAFAGIPMTFTEDGVDKYFSSAGMLQFEASQNGEKLFANPEAPVEVDLVSPNRDPEMDLFFLDAEEQGWVNIGKDSISPSLDTVSSLELLSENDLMERPIPPSFPYQRAGVNIRMKSDKKNSIYEVLLESAQSWGRSDKGIELQRFTELEAYEKGKWIIDGSKKERKMWAKRLDSIQEGINKYNLLNRGRFSLAQTDNLASSQDSARITTTASNLLLEDVWVEPNPKKDNFSLCLDLSGEIVKIPLIPKRNYGQAPSAQKRMARVYIPYAKALKQRREDWQKIEVKAQNYSDTYEELMDEYTQQINTYQKQIERLNAGELAQINEQTASYSNVTRSFSLSGFGFYNCDRIYIIQNQEKLLAKLRNENEKIISANNFIILDNTLNTVFTYATQAKVRYNRESENDLLIFMRGEKVAVFTGAYQGAFVDKRNESMYLITYDLSKMSLAEFKQQTGLLW